ncbi:MAG: hypothetical protein IJS14_10270 [Lentisphaeria bacterium]|nr:hypothetical protein [Lentisphaeria bacterium]
MMPPAKTPARIHVILARSGPKAVIFRRGPSDKVALIGWDRSNDSFELGQWLRGRIYPLRCDLSPSGEHLIYFAAKYGQENPVEKLVRAELEKHFHTVDLWRIADPLLSKAEEQIRHEHAKEIKRLERSGDYHDRSWTAISRAPYLKALSLWWNGTGWNGGGLWKNEKEFYLNRPPERITVTVPGIQSKRFREVPPDENLKRNYLWASRQGECMQVYEPRLLRDGWSFIRDDGAVWVYEKPLPGGWILRKEFPQGYDPKYEVYHQRHTLVAPDNAPAPDGSDWRWADYDDYRKRLVYAAGGAIYAMDLKHSDTPELLHDFNDMKYEPRPAPY